MDTPSNNEGIFKRTAYAVGDVLVYIFLIAIVSLASAQIISFFRPQKINLTYENGYSVFQDIFSDIDDLRKAIQASPNSPGNKDAINKVNELENTVSKIAQTVMNKPDEAITAKLLQNDQIAIKDRVAKIENELITLNGRIDTLYITIISTVLAILGLAGVSHLWQKKRLSNLQK